MDIIVKIKTALEEFFDEKEKESIVPPKNITLEGLLVKIGLFYQWVESEKDKEEKTRA